MQGREIDMEKLAQAHELTPAVGNMNVNARGDELGSGGTIARKREEVVAAYYEEKRPQRNIPTPTSQPVTQPEVAAIPAKTKKPQSEE
jgi:hypothetical protein